MVSAPANIRTAVTYHCIRLIFANRIVISLPIILLPAAVVTFKPHAKDIAVIRAKLFDLIDKKVVVFFRAECRLMHVVRRKINSKLYTLGGTFIGKFLYKVALVWHLSSAVARMSLKKAAAMYIIYAVLNGAMMASIFLVYTMTSIASVFFITAGTFAVMSAYGYLTKTDLSKMGNLCLMGLFGLIIATVVNLFLDNSFLEMILAYAGILIFVGLTAYDTKRIREIAFANNTNTTDEGVKLAILCALTLYLDFINLFIYMLRIFGEKK